MTKRTLSLVPAVLSWRSPSAIVLECLETLTQKAYAGEGWARQHMLAWEKSDASNDSGKRRMEGLIRDGIMAWARYGEEHHMQYGSDIGDDGVLGPAWKAWGSGLRDLLNGETGRLDCGTLDGLFLNIAAACGASLEE